MLIIDGPEEVPRGRQQAAYQPWGNGINGRAAWLSLAAFGGRRERRQKPTRRGISRNWEARLCPIHTFAIFESSSGGALVLNHE